MELAPFSTGRETSRGSTPRPVLSSGPPALVPYRPTDPDQLFTLPINLVWQLRYSAEEEDVARVWQVPLVAIGASSAGLAGIR